MSTKFETESWPYIPAKWQTPVQGKRDVRLIVIHAMESSEKGETAENVGLYFKRGESRASAHIGIDNNSVVQYVYDNNVAWGANGVNHDGIQIEMAGYSNQKLLEWSDRYSTDMLDRVAHAVAQYALKYSIPVIHLTNGELLAGKKGIIGHYQATAVYKPNQGHTDPGPDFPWSALLRFSNAYYNVLAKATPNSNA